MASNTTINTVSALQLEPFISTSRLASYATLTSPGPSLENLIYAYSWNKKVAAALYPVMQCLEITLRNAIHKSATAHFSQSDWYDSLLKNVADDTFSAMLAQGQIDPKFFRPNIRPRTSNNQKRWNSRHESMLIEAKRKLQNAGKSTSANNVISSLMFGFWTELFEHSYYSLTKPLLWPTLNSAVFPNLSGVNRTHSNIYNKLDALRHLRNRMSHHEPIWKNTSVTDAASAISYLSNLFSDMVFIIDGMCSERVALLEETGKIDYFRSICNEDYLYTYIRRKGIDSVDHRKLTNRIRQHINNKQTNSAVIKKMGKTILLFK